ncbi:MAG: hypothetical protein EOP04_17595, partial [Proteobacteria bacterium]
MSLDIREIVENPINASLLKYLENDANERNVEFVNFSRESISYKVSLSAHPDIVELLWAHFSKKLPFHCQAILYGRPALVNPKNGIVFG